MSKDNYLELIDLEAIPQHVAIIMDGNGRWARKRLMPRTMGHKAGVSSLKQTVKACDQIGIKYLTVYAFSTENWKRPRKEVGYLMDLLVESMQREIDELHNNQVRINVLGDIEIMPEKSRREIERALNLTRNNTGLNFNVAFNYGSRQELIRAIKDIAGKVAKQDLALDMINEKTIDEHLYTNAIPDPDLLIRTGGEQRISNFLLWQIAYSELCYIDCLWPDFTPKEFFKAIWTYQQRERRYGGLADSAKDQEYV